jgi:hypothetical protein
MSAPPGPPERLAEILLEILALSKPTLTQSESARDADPVENFGTHRVQGQSKRTKEEDKNLQRP